MGMNALEVRRRVMLAQPHEAVAVGAVASFRTDVLSPLKMSFDLLPIQNLNGQANPYPPGGGKNLFDQDNADWVTGKYINASGVVGNNGQYKYTEAYTPVNASTQYAISCTKLSSDNVLLTVCFYDSEKTFIERVQAIDFGSGTGRKSGTFTTTSETAFIRFSTVYNSSNGGSTDFQIELGNATDFAPYSNICPITGHDGFTRTGTGANVFGGLPMGQAIYDVAYTNQRNIDYVNKTVTFTRSEPVNGSYVRELFTRIKPNTQYTAIVTAELLASGTNTSLIFEYTDGTIAKFDIVQQTKTTYYFQTNSSKSVKSVCLSYYANTFCKLYYDESGIFEGALTASDFQPYTGTSYTTTFPTPPGTVYGCHVKDNGDGTGTLTVDRLMQVVDGDTKKITGRWTADNNVGNAVFYLPMTGVDRNEYTKNISDMFKTTYENYLKMDAYTCKGSSGASTTYSFALPKDVASTIDEANAWFALHPTTVVYPLATPVSYTLSLTALQSLIGQNHVWVDNADSVSVEYWGH